MGVPGHHNNSIPSKVGAARGATAGKQPFWADWGKAWSKQQTVVQSQLTHWNEHAQKEFKRHKFQMPGLKMKIDFLNPTIETIKETSSGLYRSLPPPAQAALPFVAVGLTTGLVVYKFQHGKLVVEQEKVTKLESRVAALTEERAQLRDERTDLQHTVKDLKARVGGLPRNASEMQMSKAVAEATQAAANAASAAAHAAASCYRKPGDNALARA